MDLMDIDEVSKDDSFYLPSEYKQDEVEHILQQWKQDSSTSTVSNDSQLYVDTRTFTRPKKKFAQSFIYGIGNNNPSLCTDNEHSLNTINMKIGGLVTSMQKSFINDVSPPKSIYSSMELSTCERMNNSLITSSDFSHVNFSMNNAYENNSETSFNNYKLTDVIKDREYLDNLTFLDDNLSNKDSSITCTDNTFILDNTKVINEKNNVELINSNKNTTIIKETIDTKSNNGTFCLENHNADNKTFDMSKDLMDNNTFNMIAENNTFYIVAENNECVTGPESINSNELESTNNKLFLETFKMEPIIENMDSPICDQPYEIQMSTPAVPNIKMPPLRKILNFSPIEKEKKYEHAKIDLINCTNKMKDIEKYLNDVTRHIIPDKDTIETPKIRNLDEERMSLTNFEEFEKSISILENNENEREFDDMLNSFTGARKSIENERMRQSLDSIKKRHSLINLEKQQDDIKRRENIENINTSIDSNKLIESTNKSINSSSSGSERLLNRRSRIYDNIETVVSQDVSVPLSTSETINEEITNFDNVIENNVENICKNVETVNQEDSDNVKNNRDRFKTMRIIRKQPDNTNIKNLPTAPCIDDNELSHGDNERITKKNINIIKQEKNGTAVYENEKKSFLKQPFGVNEQQKTNLRSQLARPKHLGINNCDNLTNNIQDNNNIKSNSTESLSKEKSLQLEYELDREQNSTDQQLEHQQTFIKSSNKYINNLKSPLGFKSKSIHNLLDNYPKNKNSININNNKNYKSVSDVSKLKPLNKFSLQANNKIINNNNNNNKGFESYNKKASEINTRMPQPSRLIRPSTTHKLLENNQTSTTVNLRDKSKLSLMRPTSGYYSQKNDFDAESGRFSPNSLSSSTASSSSRGSTYQPVIFEGNVKENTAMTPQEIQNKMFSKYRTQQQCVVEEIPSAQPAPQIVTVKSLPKPSGLRPPSVVNATGRSSGLPRPTTRILKNK